MVLVLCLDGREVQLVSVGTRTTLILSQCLLGLVYTIADIRLQNYWNRHSPHLGGP